MNAKEAIRNLETIGSALDKAANKPENYNTDWAHYLEQMSFEMTKHANDLRELDYIFDMGSFEVNDVIRI